MRDAGADYRFAQLNSSLPAVSPADYLREFGQAQVWLNALFYSFTGEKQVLSTFSNNIPLYLNICFAQFIVID
jgi:hypothetical protein